MCWLLKDKVNSAMDRQGCMGFQCMCWLLKDKVNFALDTPSVMWYRDYFHNRNIVFRSESSSASTTSVDLLALDRSTTVIVMNKKH